MLPSENMIVFERSLDLIDGSIAELRRIAYNMMPEGLVAYGLDEALKQYCSSINTNGMLRVKYQSVGLANPAAGRSRNNCLPHHSGVTQ